jgi:hypothetical protein
MTIFSQIRLINTILCLNVNKIVFIETDLGKICYREQSGKGKNVGQPILADTPDQVTFQGAKGKKCKNR